MLKRKKSKKRGFSLNDMPTLKTDKKSKLKKHDSEAFFKDFNKVGTALLESLVQNDTEAFIEILDAYLKVNRAQVAKRAKISRSTVQQALSKKGNPTLKTIAKIVHESVA
ncbi:MAG: helix-turn-helix domain-containing protein [Verrucomicrobia bacterium]|nr:helix-turn-helix domain-containing protein [Verrucomicrobiota bacterium]